MKPNVCGTSHMGKEERGLVGETGQGLSDFAINA